MKNLYLIICSAFALNTNAQLITTFAGNGTYGFSGDGGAATAAEINSPYGVAVDAAGNLYIADAGNSRIRRVNTAGIISTYAGNGTLGYTGDGGQATAAELYSPSGVALDAAGNVYITDYNNNRIRRVSTSGIISALAGNGIPGYTGDGGAATAAELQYPPGVAVDAAGNVYIADQGNNVIRMVSTAGIISTFAGNGTMGYTGDGGAATAAELNTPFGVAVDAAGNVYIADDQNNRIRKVTTAGIISTIAGNGTYGYSGDGGAATAAELSNPAGVAVDASGNMYIADYNNNRIRKVTTAGIISTVAGNGTMSYAGDGGAATAAELYHPAGVAFDAAGNLYIADYNNQRIRMVCNSGSSCGAGIEQVSGLNSNISVYPNPASTSLTLTLSEGEGTYNISLYDMLGNEVMQGTYSSPSGRSGGASIDVADLAEGVYFINIKTEQGTRTKKLIINK